MRLIEGSQSVPGEEPDVELALREALGNPVMHGNQEDPGKKYTSSASAGPAREYPSSWRIREKDLTRTKY
jgi:anti-sigma regulatory factor (Ser/Thr protein kinase)